MTYYKHHEEDGAGSGLASETESMRRVYFIACAFPPFSRGNSITNACVAGNLSKTLDVVVICMQREDGFFLNYQEDKSLVANLPDDLRVKRIRASNWLLANELFYGIGLLPCYFINWAWAVLRKRNRLIDLPGVIFAVYPVFSDLIVGWVLAKRYNCPLIVDFRDDFAGVMSVGRRRFLGAVYRWLEFRLIDGAQAVTVTTEYLKDSLISRHGVDESKIVVVHNVVPQSAESHQNASKSGSAIRIAYAGAISRIQTPELLLKAYNLLVEQRSDLANEFEIDIYGPESWYFRKRLRRHIRGRARYLGFVDRGELLERLRSVDIGFVSLSDNTFAYAIPTKLIEYIQLGIPVLGALPKGAARDLIEKNQIGFVCDPGDEAGMVACLKCASLKPSVLVGMRKNVESVRKEFCVDFQVDSWRKLIEDVDDRKNKMRSDVRGPESLDTDV